ncbi:hypothetical protein LY28_02775 [Ruminiclostridium sufflavum DSM 19573]|uniref:Uncharacterized protein n=1 Tax=Ruminiclostridium sufflavum DSM 19573 TaxID=1121337 RepID=A0A318XM62_9FIRM|nr:hypothetical protein [Ruminiclostridium sufflavum]PYG86749.1 hypothetical protein LY28_02775 [Ruminiclostridium sufflavum DSM 19573]
MTTRIIYDTTGQIINQMQGSDLYTPEGIPCLDVDIPEGRYVTGIDVSVTPNAAIFEDLPKSKTDLLQERIINLETDNLDLSVIVLDLLLEKEV